MTLTIQNLRGARGCESLNKEYITADLKDGIFTNLDRKKCKCTSENVIHIIGIVDNSVNKNMLAAVVCTIFFVAV